MYTVCLSIMWGTNVLCARNKSHNIRHNARVNLHTQDAQGIGQGASMVLVSVKDDLYTITSAELKKCGYRVLKLDLRNVFCSCHFNLLCRDIRISAKEVEKLLSRLFFFTQKQQGGRTTP